LGKIFVLNIDLRRLHCSPIVSLFDLLSDSEYALLILNKNLFRHESSYLVCKFIIFESPLDDSMPQTSLNCF